MRGAIRVSAPDEGNNQGPQLGSTLAARARPLGASPPPPKVAPGSRRTPRFPTARPRVAPSQARRAASGHARGARGSCASSGRRWSRVTACAHSRSRAGLLPPVPPNGACNQRRLEAIRGDPRPSKGIKGNQRSSEAIRGHQRRSAAISGDQRRSEAIRGDSRRSEAPRAAPPR